MLDICIGNRVSALRPASNRQSFCFSEVLKYLYGVCMMQLAHYDNVSKSYQDVLLRTPLPGVFNTEDHPFKAPVAKESYGTNIVKPSDFTQPVHPTIVSMCCFTAVSSRMSSCDLVETRNSMAPNRTLWYGLR